MSAFFRKEMTEHMRRKRIFVMGILFLLFAVLGVVTAKLTPLLLEMVADQMPGFAIDKTESDIWDAWGQYFKNIDIPLIVFLILWSGSFTTEYQKHTLIPLVTKGLSRTSIFVSKMVSAALVWTAGYILYFGVFYFYSDFYWGNGELKNVAVSVGMYWLYGLWLLAILGLFSSFAETTMQVLLGVGGVFFLCSFVEFVPKLAPKLPTALTGGLGLMQGGSVPSDFTVPFVIVLISIVLCTAGGIALIQKKQL